MPNYDPLREGFRRFAPARNTAINGGISVTSRKKLASSTNNVKKGHPVIAGTGGTYDRCTVAGTNEVQTLTFAGTVTSFTLAFTGRSAVTGLSVTKTTPAIAYNSDFTALAAAVQTQLGLLENVGPGNVTVVRTSGTVLTVTFTGWLGARNVAQLTAPTVNGGGSVTPATGTAGVAGYVSDTALLGFAEFFEQGSISNWPRQFAQPVDLNLDGKTWAETKEMNIFPLADQVFRGAIEHDVIVDASTMVGTDYNIGWYPALEQCYIATQLTSNVLVTVVSVAPDQDGVVGGIVDFVVKSAAIALI